MDEFNTPARNSLLRRLVERFFPKVPDFFNLLSEQSVQVRHTARLLVEYLETGDPAIGQQIRQEEQAAGPRQRADAGQ